MGFLPCGTRDNHICTLLDEAARAWMTAMNHLATHHNGESIHLDETTFNPTDFDLAPFAGRTLATSIQFNLID
jgi:hypothetical protein